MLLAVGAMWRVGARYRRQTWPPGRAWPGTAARRPRYEPEAARRRAASTLHVPYSRRRSAGPDPLGDGVN